MFQQNSNVEIDKHSFKLKTSPKDGVILQVHHTTQSSNGDSIRIKFILCCFNETNEGLACVDHAGNLFIFDLYSLKFWKITKTGPISAIKFLPDKPLLAAANNCTHEINLIAQETGHIVAKLCGHTDIVRHISYSFNKKCILLTASGNEAILWNMSEGTKHFTLNTNLGPLIVQISFSPDGNYLVAGFKNNTLQIWRCSNMKPVKRIVLSEIKHITGLAFTSNARALALSGLSPTLVLVCMDTWQVIKTVNLSKYGISGIRHIAFIPQVFDGGANKMIGILTSNCFLHILDIENFDLKKITPEKCIMKRFVVSPSGKYLACILKHGEINLYKSFLVTAEMKNKEPIKTFSQGSLSDISSAFDYEEAKKISTYLNSSRLKRILLQFGEYPEKFRSIIWKSILQAPRNKVAYDALVQRGMHKVFKNIENEFTIQSVVIMNSLKHVLSCLTHWCPLFGIVKYMPAFVFPFVKILHRDPLLLFECVATILLNHCQLWFEYAPFPPLSLLEMVENILSEHDKVLLKHFCNHGVTSQSYALKILESAFSEVFLCADWLILWDHIISNEPSFMLMAVVSYSIVQRNAILKMNTPKEIETYFQSQNTIEIKTFIKKSYYLLNSTSSENHPRKFYSDFVPLEKGDCYQQFSAYPKATICLKLSKLEKG